jgi:hypothetical protein
MKKASSNMRRIVVRRRSRALAGFAVASLTVVLLTTASTQSDVQSAAAAIMAAQDDDVPVAPPHSVVGNGPSIPAAVPISSSSNLAETLTSVTGPLAPAYFAVAPNTNVPSLGSRLVVTVGFDPNHRVSGRAADVAWKATPSHTKQAYLSSMLDAVSAHEHGTPVVVRLVQSSSDGNQQLLSSAHQNSGGVKGFSQDERSWSHDISW